MSRLWCHYRFHASHWSFWKVFELLNIVRRIGDVRNPCEAAARATPDIKEFNNFLDWSNWTLFQNLFHQMYFGFRAQVSFCVFDLKAISSKFLAFGLETTFVYIDAKKFFIKQLFGNFISMRLSVLLLLGLNDFRVRNFLHGFFRSHFVSLSSLSFSVVLSQFWWMNIFVYN